LPDYSWYKIPKREKYTELPRSTTKDRKSVYKIIQPLSARPSKIYPNLDFWFENKPSANLMLLLFDT
jgi:hypothetical protein